MNHYIVDLSSNNHDGPIDHKAAMDDLRARGGGAQPGAVVKASEGPSYGNPDYQIDIDGTLAADGAVATYHFLHSSASAESQLANLKNNLARVQNPGKCWADVEEGGLD
ncbi:MAG: hypothetical protein KGL39_57835, partial [Patescibacteria group bacterium]|nr:hypothetical protein [Patescibacteria group bacterium]